MEGPISSRVYVEASPEAIECWQQRVRDLIYLESLDASKFKTYDERATHYLNLSTLAINKKLLTSIGFDVRDLLN